MSTFYLHTLGCRLNQAESNKMAEDLSSAGFNFTDQPEQADLFIINTCSVTHKADRESRQIARRLKRSNSAAKIIVTGCSQSANEEIDLYLKNKHKIVAASQKLIGEPESNSCTQLLFNADQRTRALVKIQTGCDNYCAYCIVPYLRGKPASVEIEEIIENIKLKEKQGFKEIVLTGINIGKYGRDNKRDTEISDLIIEILKRTTIERLRLSSINPEDIDEKLMNLFVDDRLCQHLHLSLQSGSDSVLKKMGRKYTTNNYLDIVTKLYREYPNFAFTTDIIVGFPGETDKEFQASGDFLKKIGFLQTHIFRYSIRKRTKAAKMSDQIDEKVKKARAKKLSEVAGQSRKKFQDKMIGRKLSVLLEKEVKKGIYHGRAGNYLKVQVEDKNGLTNTIKYVKVSEHNLVN